MKWIISTFVLLFAVSLMAQPKQQEVAPNSGMGQMNSYATHQPAMSNSDVYHQIQSRLSTNSDLTNAEVTATVTDSNVVLSGYVNSQDQVQAAVAIAQAYTNGRELVNNIQVGGLQGGY